MAKIKKEPTRASGRAAAGRIRLLLVAMKLFAERGFDSVTVRDISTEAGVSVGLINHHFVSKDGLRAAVDDYFVKRTGKAIELAIEATGDLDPDVIASYQEAWIVSSESEWPQFLAYLRRALMDASPWSIALVTRYHEHIRTMIDRFDARGHIRPDVDRLWLPFLYLFVLLGPLVLDPFIRSAIGKSTYDPEMWGRFQKASSKLMWKGIGTPDAKP